jgi:hypothetical protein
MAKRGIPRSPGYIPGSHWAICDFCTSQFRASDLKKTWDGWWVCDDDFEHRHPQDFLRVKEEHIYVDDPIRPENTDNEIDVTFEETTSVPSGTFDNEI